jgi:uncharacterized membrane protein YhaH (DUF805 family)
MSSRVASRRWSLAVRLTAGALVWSIGLMIAAVVIPAYGTETSSQANGVTLMSSTLLQDKGAGALVLVTIPALVSLIVLIAIRARRGHDAAWSGRVAWTAIGAVTVESILGIATIGAFMLPVAILLTLSVRLVPSAGDRAEGNRTEGDSAPAPSAAP